MLPRTLALGIPARWRAEQGHRRPRSSQTPRFDWMEEYGVAGDGSTSLSTICARMIQSCTYTVAVKVCGSGTEINGDTCFRSQIIEGTSTNLKDLIACIAGTLSFPLSCRTHNSNKNGQQQCPICKEFGHRWQSCKNAAPEALEAYAEVAKQKRNKRKNPITKAICTTSDQVIEGTVPPLPCTTETGTALAIEDKTAKSTSPKTTSKSKRSKIISAAPDSPAMSTRSKKRAAPNSQPMATRRKKKFKL